MGGTGLDGGGQGLDGGGSPPIVDNPGLNMCHFGSIKDIPDSCDENDEYFT